jgi:glutamyl-tRNA reductase
VVPWAWFPGALPDVDAVVCATGAPAPVISASSLESAVRRTGNPRIVVDLSVPANVERPAVRLPSVRVLDVDDLSSRLREEAGRRTAAVAKVEAIVEAELQEWRDWARARAGREKTRSRGTGRVAG